MKQEELNSLTQSIIDDIHNYEFHAESPELFSSCYNNVVTFGYEEFYLLANLKRPQLPDYLARFIKVVKNGDEYSLEFQNGCELTLMMYCLDKAYKSTL